MKKFGLTGHPISHSLSPQLFCAGYDGKYPYDLITGDDFNKSYRQFIESYDGINVTAPFKAQACEKADILSEECLMTGAANILVKTGDGVKAYNSDYLGIRKWLLEEAIPELSPAQESQALSSKYLPTVLVAGCGGAGKAAAFAAKSLGMQTILMNRDMRKAEELAEAAPDIFTARPLHEFSGCFNDCDIIIYTIPSGIPALETLAGHACPHNGSSHKIIIEANYRNPAFCPSLISRLQNAMAGIWYVGGKTWLLYQALTGYEILTGEKPDLARMHTCL